MPVCGRRSVRAGVLALLCGCAANDADSGAPPAPRNAAPEALSLAFSSLYSAYDGVHSFTLPLRVEGGAPPLTVTTEPEGFLDWEPTSAGVMLSMRMAGSATVIVEDSQGRRGARALHVTEATPEAVSAGEERYYNDYLYETGTLALGRLRSCHECHGKDHSQDLVAPGVSLAIAQVFVPTPQQLAGYSDEQLLGVIEAGEKLPGSPYRVLSVPLGFESDVFRSIHVLQQSDGQTRRALVAFLRSLEPRSQPPLDFGGLTNEAPAMPSHGDDALAPN